MFPEYKVYLQPAIEMELKQLKQTFIKVQN